MKKIYETPEVQIEKIEIQDVVTNNVLSWEDEL